MVVKFVLLCDLDCVSAANNCTGDWWLASLLSDSDSCGISQKEQRALETLCLCWKVIFNSRSFIEYSVLDFDRAIDVLDYREKWSYMNGLGCWR